MYSTRILFAQIERPHGGTKMFNQSKMYLAAKYSEISNREKRNRQKSSELETSLTEMIMIRVCEIWETGMSKQSIGVRLKSNNKPELISICRG